MMENNLLIESLNLPGLKRLVKTRIADHRGYLQRLYCFDFLDRAGIKNRTIKQINRTFTKQQGCVRGLHFQYPPHAEIKIITCLQGKVFDVAVDLRKTSPTYLKWHAEILTPEDNNSLIIPEGFAHGFQTLTPNCELLYFHTANYIPSSEGGLSAIDSTLAINWPLPITERSERDSHLPLILDHFKGLDYAM